MDMNSVTASAKVNLCLRVLGKAEGYHNLQSLVAFADFTDELQIASAPADEVIWHGEGELGGGSPTDNILIRTLHEVRNVVPLPPLQVTLLKRIPMGAGLGGGSADAAALLRYCVEHYNLPHGEAHRIAALLGSDITVCLSGRVSWMSGRGNELSAVQPFPEVHCLLVMGLQPLSTAAVFAGFGGDYSQPIKQVSGFKNYGDLLGFLHEFGGNDLWDSACRLCPDLQELREILTGDYVGMSGSGSVMFALFESDAACRATHHNMKEKYNCVPCRLGDAL